MQPVKFRTMKKWSSRFRWGFFISWSAAVAVFVVDPLDPGHGASVKAFIAPRRIDALLHAPPDLFGEAQGFV
ncbi:hypothetical protein SDC9_05424 [bioreactor metagenome]|uniref:Uncharacterized protein n=1 Tax=bioreactor metagenome TaxID=1076179 RepID=A0A644SYU4_9ZZZZ